MTREQKIEAIRAWCVKANPDIVKLEFGCKVTKKRGSGNIYMAIGEPYALDGAIGCLFLPLDSGTNSEIRMIEIIGRDIRLADVLLAMNKIDDYAVLVSVGGNFYKQYIGGDGDWYTDTLGAYWNLRADNLNNQSDETIDFIHSLIPTV